MRALAWSALGTLLAALAAGPPALASDRAARAASRSTLAAHDAGPESHEARKHVLLLYAESRLLPALVAADEVIRSTLQAGSPDPIYFYTEYLDLSLLTGEPARSGLRDFLRRKYAHLRLDLVIAGGGDALRFVLENRVRLFPGAPVVFSAAEGSPAARVTSYEDVTGVPVSLDWAETLDLALRLQPGTRRVVVVAGTSRTDVTWLAAARAQLAPYQARLEITYLTDLPFAEILRRVAALPDRTVLLLGAFLRDAAGHDLISREAIAEIAGASRVPAYGLSDTYIGAGVVGGRCLRFEAIGASVAGLGLRVLRGERSVPPVAVASVPMADWRQLRRWRLDETRLPRESVVRFRPPSAWQLYRGYIVGGLALIGLESALIVGLLVQRAQRRRAQQALGERLRFETLLSELSTSFIALPPDGLDGEIEHWLRRFGEDLGLDQASLLAVNGAGDHVRFTHSWTRQGVAPAPRTVATGGFPWVSARLLDGQVVRFSRPQDLPDEAATDRRSFIALGTRSLVVVPLRGEGPVTGALSFNTLRVERDWSDDLVQRLRLVGEVFANALARRQAESAARESEDRFRLMADSAPVMMWTSGPDARRSSVNQRWLDFTGRPRERELGEGWAEGVHPDDCTACLDGYRRAFDERRAFTLEYRLRRSDGAYRWIVDYGVARIDPDGAFRGYAGSAVDVTEVKAASQALAESHALRSAILGSLYGQVAAIDGDGVIIAVNESWTRFAEENGGDVSRVSVGANYLQACRDAVARGDADAGRALEAITSVLRGSSAQGGAEYACHSPAEKRWFAMVVEPFRRPEGGAVVSHVDITRQRASEEALQISHAQVRELAGRLITAQEEERRRLSRDLHDDLNQKVAGLALAIAHLQRLVAPADAVLREGLVHLHAEAAGLADHVRRLSHDLHPAVLELAGLAAALRGFCDEFRGATGIDVALDLPASLEALPADVALCLFRVAQEALRNVAQHAGARRAEVAVRIERDTVALTVRDAGAGFDAAALRQGRGLGIVSMDERVRLVGGSVTIRSAPGAGTEVAVAVPLGRRAS